MKLGSTDIHWLGSSIHWNPLKMAATQFYASSFGDPSTIPDWTAPAPVLRQAPGRRWGLYNQILFSQNLLIENGSWLGRSNNFVFFNFWLQMNSCPNDMIELRRSVGEIPGLSRKQRTLALDIRMCCGSRVTGSRVTITQTWQAKEE